MDPATIAALSSLVGGLGGLFGGGNDRLDAKKLEQLFGVGALNKDTQKLFDFLNKSQFGEFGKSNAALQGSLFGDELKRRGAAIGGSGVGMIASSAAGATQAFQEGSFLSQLFAQAQSGAQENLGARLNAYASGGNQSGPSGFGALAGAIANAGGQYALLSGSKTKSPDPFSIAKSAVDADIAANPPQLRKKQFSDSNLGSLLAGR